MFLTQALRRMVRADPDRPVVIGADGTISRADFLDRVARTAATLKRSGLRKGDRVAVLARNCEAYLVWYFAVPWAGGITVPLNFRWSVEELDYALTDTEAHILIVDETFPEVAAQLAKRHPKLVVWESRPTCGAAFFNDRDAAVPASDPVPDESPAPGEPFAIFYTGGTTGHPKGVMLSSLNLWSSAMTLIAATGLDEDDRYLHVGPMFHLADAVMTIALALTGGAHVVLPAYDPGAVLDIVARHRVTRLTLVPTMLKDLLDHPSSPDADLSSLRGIVYGASPISESLLEAALARLPGLSFVQAYGQTELSPIATLLEARWHGADPALAPLRKSAGRATWATEVKIADEDGRVLPTDTVGEIWCRGPNVMLGYWRRPDLTAATIVDGWVRTGDAGRMDAQGFLYVVDRLKDMIVSGAENVYSAEVENALLKHPGVDSCAVIGVPDDRWGERVHAIVVPRAGKTLDGDALTAHCRTLIAGYKCPRSYDIRLEPLPLSAAGKILKRDLREPYWQGRDRRVG